MRTRDKVRMRGGYVKLSRKNLQGHVKKDEASIDLQMILKINHIMISSVLYERESGEAGSTRGF